MDVSDFEGIKNIKQSYIDMEKELEFTPHEVYMDYLMQLMQQYFI